MNVIKSGITALLIIFSAIAYANDNAETSFQNEDENDILYIEEYDSNIELGDRIPLLLIHGWNPESAGEPPAISMWNNIINSIKSNPELQANYKLYTISYWSNSISVQELGAALKEDMETIGLSNKRVVILTHSMGGLVSRSFMNEQTYSDGIFAGKKCGEAVRLLVTLGSPHHGSPIANGDARDAKASALMKILMDAIEQYAFNDLPSNKPSRSDLRWDNFDNLLDYTSYPDDANNWLSELNKNTDFDAKTICYIGNIEGSISTNTDMESVYKLGAYLTESIFNIKNDGIVPYKSAAFEGHEIMKSHFFDGYNHRDLYLGKSKDNYALMDSIQADIIGYKPLRFISEINSDTIKNDSTIDIKWSTSDDDSLIDIALSTNNGASFETFATVDAQLESFAWQVPNINADSCLLKIYRNNAEYEYDLSDQTFAIAGSPETENPANTITLLPCFEFSSSNDGSIVYRIEIQHNDSVIKLSSNTNTVCVPNNLEYELEPGTEYSVTAYELNNGDSISTVTTYITEATKPYSFDISEPNKGTTVDKEDVTIIWNRAVGASHYNIVVTNDSDTLLNLCELAKTDTIAVVNMGGWHRNDSIKIEIEAINKYGTTRCSSFFYNSYKTKFEELSRNNIDLTIYPNPASEDVYFNFDLTKESRIELAIHDLSGRKIEQILDEQCAVGSHQIKWNSKTRHLSQGIYIIKLKNGIQTISKKLLIK